MYFVNSEDTSKYPEVIYLKQPDKGQAGGLKIQVKLLSKQSNWDHKIWIFKDRWLLNKRLH